MDGTVQSMQAAGDLAVSRAFPLRVNPGTTEAQMDKTSKDFESMFMSQMLQPMFEGLSVDPIFGGGHGEEVMRGLLVQEYGKMASKSGKVGIAASVKSEMLRAQANANGTKVSNAQVTNSLPPTNLPVSTSNAQSSLLGGNYDAVQ